MDNGVQIIKSSNKVNKIYRAFDVISSLLLHYFSYKIAIVPYYASKNAYVIENWSTLILRLLRKKIIIVVHGGGLPIRLSNNAPKYLKVLNRADTIVCPSPYLQHEIGKYHIESIVIENVLKLSDYQFHQKQTFRPNILWMRAFEDVYHPFMAVEVLAKLKETFPEAKMIMAGGDAGLLQQTKELAVSKGLQNDIEFPGYITNEQKNNLSLDFDIYICTNKIDNAPVTLVEMMCLGLPIVTVNSGGIPYMINNGENGILVEFDDVNAMKSAICEIIQNPELGKKLVQNGLLTTKKYGAEPILQKWISLFNQLN
ncbi:MAG: glycosyltransferase family 4 protein [Chitinophagales bacterium]|nr:glycosyltransferase family 4 protein [Chitinophagales bacterium]